MKRPKQIPQRILRVLNWENEANKLKRSIFQTNIMEVDLGEKNCWYHKCRPLIANLHTLLRGSLPKSGPLDFATKNTFPFFFVGEEALLGVY